MVENKQNPFLDMGFNKMMDMSKNMDISKMMDMSKFMDMSKMMDMSKFMDMSKLSMPESMSAMPIKGVDVEAVSAAYRKNMEALKTANQMLCESGQSLAKRQMDITRQNFEAIVDLARAMFAAQTAAERVTKQTELARTAMDNCIAGMREMSEEVVRNQSQAMELVRTRVTESLEEMGRSSANKKNSKAAE